jgi:REP element-mobilizing transposase RayT
MVSYMATPKRFQGPGYFHVYTVATGGEELFRDDLDRQVLVQRLGRISMRLGWRVFAYTLLTTHYHAVLQTRDASLSRGMQCLNAGYAQLYNQRWTRSGTLVARRFGYRVIESEEYLAAVCRYVWLNPVRARLCLAAADWSWNGGDWFSMIECL